MDFQDYDYVCHLNENMILPKLSDDEVKPLDVPESCKCIPHVPREHVYVGSQVSHAVYSVDVLAVSLYNIIMSKYIMYIFQLYYYMVLNGKMGEPNTCLYENCRTTYRKITSCE